MSDEKRERGFFRPLIVTCELAGPLAGDPPMLDSLALCMWTVLRRDFRRCRRQDAAPDVLRHFASDRFPIAYTVVGGHVVPHASAPIMAVVRDDRHVHYHRRFPVPDAVRLCAPDQRGVVPTTMTVTKSYRLPERVRTISRVAWIIEGNERELLKLLREVYYIGRDRGHGWGVVATRREEEESQTAVACWDVRESPVPAWWYAEHPDGRVLMRPLPAGAPCPGRLLGSCRQYAACSPPYWHPDRLTEVVSPC